MVKRQELVIFCLPPFMDALTEWIPTPKANMLLGQDINPEIIHFRNWLNDDSPWARYNNDASHSLLRLYHVVVNGDIRCSFTLSMFGNFVYFCWIPHVYFHRGVFVWTLVDTHFDISESKQGNMKASVLHRSHRCCFARPRHLPRWLASSHSPHPPQPVPLLLREEPTIYLNKTQGT